MTHILNDIEIGKVKEEMCDSYCKYPYEVKDAEALEFICEGCPLNRLEEGHDDL